jgi:hypothetical protein
MSYQAEKIAIEDELHLFCLAGVGSWTERTALYWSTHSAQRERYVALSGEMALLILPAKFQRQQMAAALDEDETTTGSLPFELEGVPPIRISACVEVEPNDWRAADDVSIEQDCQFRDRLAEKHFSRANYQKRTSKQNKDAGAIIDQRLPGGSRLPKRILRREWQQLNLFSDAYVTA